MKIIQCTINGGNFRARMKAGFLTRTKARYIFHLQPRAHDLIVIPAIDYHYNRNDVSHASVRTLLTGAIREAEERERRSFDTDDNRNSGELTRHRLHILFPNRKRKLHAYARRHVFR
jgi:hypothetical protein